MKDLSKIKYWLFDLDNTLYDGATKVFDQVDKKMTKFISEKLNVKPEEARKIQKNYFLEYNTTLNGMIKNHKIDAEEFLEFVHDVDLNFLKKDSLLEKEITKLKGKKLYLLMDLEPMRKTLLSELVLISFLMVFLILETLNLFQNLLRSHTKSL